MESQEMEKKLNKEEYDKWTNFRSVKSTSINPKEQELIASIHSKYFFHNFYKPCTCSAKTWNKWIEDINNLYADGYRKNS